jgi:hypothetical protein
MLLSAGSTLEAKETELQDLQESFDDLIATSKEIEEQLEGELNECKAKVRILEAKVCDQDVKYAKLQTAWKADGDEISRLQVLVTKLEEAAVKSRQDKVGLEQDNDCYESRLREAEATIEKLKCAVETAQEYRIIAETDAERYRYSWMAEQEETEVLLEENSKLRMLLESHKSYRNAYLNSNRESIVANEIKEIIDEGVNVNCCLAHRDCWVSATLSKTPVPSAIKGFNAGARTCPWHSAKADSFIVGNEPDFLNDSIDIHLVQSDHSGLQDITYVDVQDTRFISQRRNTFKSKVLKAAPTINQERDKMGHPSVIWMKFMGCFGAYEDMEESLLTN